MRQYEDEVEVRWDETPTRSPGQFLWRGRLWKVRAVLARWVETPPWWTGRVSSIAEGTPERSEQSEQSGPGAARSEFEDLMSDRECWRVEAGSGALPGTGVFDLAWDSRADTWQLTGCAD